MLGPARDGEGGETGDTIDIDTTYIGGGGKEYLDSEIVESKIKSIEDKWKAEVDKLENERVCSKNA